MQQKLAFNLAFDVSHNIREFDEALLAAVDAGVERDFVKILNSMTKDRLYDMGSLASMIEEAKQKLRPSAAPESAAPEELQEELDEEPETEEASEPLADMETLQIERSQLIDQRTELMDSLRDLQQDMSDLNPTLISAIRMKMIVTLCVGLGFVLILAAINQFFFAFLLLIAVLFVFLVSVGNEKSAMRKKQLALNPDGQKLFEHQIAEIKMKIVQIEKQIHSKEEAIKALQIVQIGKIRVPPVK
ncbi:MAG: hypothetical protein AB1656_00440 [Candidatus Omnitrophota bacterium]